LLIDGRNEWRATVKNERNPRVYTRIPGGIDLEPHRTVVDLSHARYAKGIRWVHTKPIISYMLSTFYVDSYLESCLKLSVVPSSPGWLPSIEAGTQYPLW